MNAAPHGLSSDRTPARLDLPDRDPAAVAAATRLIARLDGAAVGALSMHAALARAEAADLWLSAPGAPMVAVRAVDGAPVTLHPDRVDAVAAAIDAAAPLLDAVESLTGWRFEFGAAVPDADPRAAVITVGMGGSSVALAVRADPPAPNDGPPGATIRIGRSPVPLSLILAGPALSIPAAGGIAAGDLLVLGAGPWRATVEAAGLYQQFGTYSATGHWTMHDPHADDAGEPGAPDGVAAFTVPVSVHLPETSASLGTLEGLVPGSVLPILPLTGGLRVDLRIAGRIIAWGEVVRLGDDFAVAIDRVPGLADRDGDD